MPRRQVLRSQARQMVHDVLTFMKNEAQEGLQFDLKAVQKRTAAATGVSQRTVRRIAVAASVPGASMHEVFRTPGRRRVGKKKVTAISSTNLGVIKRSIHNFHITESELPTVKLLLRKLKHSIHFKGQASSLRRILTELGFKWRQTEDNRKVLIEHASIRQKRIEYLQAITKHRAEGRSVVFADASNVDTTQNESTAKGSRKSERLIIVHAVTETGFLPNALLTFKSNSKSDDNKHYDKWLQTQLIPNLPENAVVVVGKARYFNKSEDATPTSTSKRSFMETWLLEKGIPYYSTMLKPQLYKLICTYKCGFRQYKIDGILNEHNHPVLRIPDYHPDLNPLETAWTAIKDHFAGSRSAQTAKTQIQQKVSEIDGEISALCKSIEIIEQEYCQSDVVIDTLTDEITVHVSDNESDDETDDDSGSEEQNDSSSSDEEVVSEEAEVMEVNISPESILS